MRRLFSLRLSRARCGDEYRVRPNKRPHADRAPPLLFLPRDPVSPLTKPSEFARRLLAGHFLSSPFRPAWCAAGHAHHATHAVAVVTKTDYGIGFQAGDYCAYALKHGDTSPRVLQNSETPTSRL